LTAITSLQQHQCNAEALGEKVGSPRKQVSSFLPHVCKKIWLASGTLAKTEQSHHHCWGIWEQGSPFEVMNMSWSKSEVSREQRSEQDNTGGFVSSRPRGAKAYTEIGVTKKI